VTFKVNLDIPHGLETGSVLISEEVIGAIRNSGLSIERAAKSLAPFKTGNLRRTIKAQPVTPLGGKPTGIVSSAANYAKYVEYGTGIYHKPDAHTSFRGKIPGVGWRIIKGMKAQPYMLPAFEMKRELIIKRMEKALQAVVERMKQ